MKFSAKVAKHPPRFAAFAYGLLIVFGTLLLLHPACRQCEKPISILDAAFTATSAVSVTGLAVRSTGNEFSWLGQLVILLLIQVGGIGITTITTFVTLQFGGHRTLRSQLQASETFGTFPGEDLRWVISTVTRVVLMIEAAGFLLLFIRFSREMPISDAAWFALFHSVSAYCNAGFGLLDDSLVRYSHDIIINTTIAALIVLGGIGVPVILDIRKHWRWNLTGIWPMLSIHSRLSILGTLFLIVVGASSFLALEWNNTLKDLPFLDRTLIATFHSISCRTAGFNSIDIASLTNAMLFISMGLMIIGACPCSAGGGFKVSSLFVLILLAWSKMRGEAQVVYSKKAISKDNVDRALTVVLLYFLIAAIGITLICAFEQSDMPHKATTNEKFLDIAFEVVSAVGTVGLSTGITAGLGSVAKIVLIVLMFAGRLGPITFFAALTRTTKEQPFSYPKQEVLVG